MALVRPYEEVIVQLHTDGTFYWVYAHRQLTPTLGIGGETKGYKSKKWAIKRAQALLEDLFLEKDFT